MRTESLIGPIPDHWAVSTLGAVADRAGGNIQTGPFGSQLHASDYVDDGIPSIMPKNIGDNRVEVDGIARITEADAKRLQRYRVRSGDIVYSRRGDVEKRALIRDAEGGWLCGTGCLRVRFGDNSISPEYASFYLGHPRVRAWIVRHAHGATMPNLNTALLSALPFVVPPLAEQRTIAHILGTLDDKIELNRKMNATLDEIARILFTSWFVNFDPVRAKAEGRQPDGMDADTAALFPDRLVDSELGPIPEGWEWSTLGEMFALNPRRTLPQGTEATFLEMKNVATYGHRPLGVDKKAAKGGARFQNGDTLLARITPCLENGKTAFVDFLGDGDVGFGSTEYIVMQASSPLPRIWSYLVARHEPFRQFAIQNMTGTSGRQRVGADDVAKFESIMPSATVAETFGQLVQPWFHLIRANDEESRTLTELRDTLLPELLSGRVRVGEAEALMGETV